MGYTPREMARSSEDPELLLRRVGEFVLKAVVQGQMRLSLGDCPEAPVS